jgi:hypothetical protein
MRFANGIGKMQAIAKDAATRGLFWLGSPRVTVSIRKAFIAGPEAAAS